MRIVRVLSVVCISSFVFLTTSFAEADKWTIITSAHDTLRSCIIGEVEGDVFNLICDSAVIQIAVDALSKLIRHKESRFWSGATYGAFAGFALGAIVGAATHREPANAIVRFGDVSAIAGGILGGAVGFAIGGIIGGAAGGDEIIDLSQRTLEQKISILRALYKGYM